MANDTLYTQFEKRKNTTLVFSFSGTKYSIKKKYRFSCTDEAAKLIIQSCMATNSLEQVNLNAFSNDILTQFNFENSDIEFKTLQLLNWDYAEIVVSAVYFYLENLYKNYLNRKNKIFFKDKSFYELDIVSSKLKLVFLNKNYGKKFFTVIESTDLLRIYSYHWLFGFNALLRFFSTNILKSSYNQEKYFFLVK